MSSYHHHPAQQRCCRPLLALMALVAFNGLLPLQVTFTGGRFERSPMADCKRRGGRTKLSAFWDDMMKSAGDKAIEAMTGMSSDELKTFQEKCNAGNLDFRDFQSVNKLLNGMQDSVAGGALSGAAAAMDERMQEELETLKEKMREKDKIIDTMTEEERTTPTMFLSGKIEDRRKAVLDLADRTNNTEGDISQFLMEYLMITEMMPRVSKGEFDLQDMEENIEKRRAEFAEMVNLNPSISKGGRAKEYQQRGKDGKKKKKKRKLPEWMTL